MPTPEIDRSQVAWHISTRSDGGSVNCVEAGPVADGSARVAVRHSRHPHGRVIAYDRAEWQAFTAGVKAGEFTFT